MNLDRDLCCENVTVGPLCPYCQAFVDVAVAGILDARMAGHSDVVTLELMQRGAEIILGIRTPGRP